MLPSSRQISGPTLKSGVKNLESTTGTVIKRRLAGLGTTLDHMLAPTFRWLNQVQVKSCVSVSAWKAQISWATRVALFEVQLKYDAIIYLFVKVLPVLVILPVYYSCFLHLVSSDTSVREIAIIRRSSTKNLPKHVAIISKHSSNYTKQGRTN